MLTRAFVPLAAIAALLVLPMRASAQGTDTTPTKRATSPTRVSICTDGSKSTITGRGACSGHGGVDAKATAAAQKAVTTEPAATVVCTDGSSSPGGRGACAGHGGVRAPAAKPLDR